MGPPKKPTGFFWYVPGCLNPENNNKFNFGLYRLYPVLPMGKTDCFTQFYPTGFTHWVKHTCQPCPPNYLTKLRRSVVERSISSSDSVIIVCLYSSQLCPVCLYSSQLCPVCLYSSQLCPVCLYSSQLCPVCLYSSQLCPVCLYSSQLCPAADKDSGVHLRGSGLARVLLEHSTPTDGR